MSCTIFYILYISQSMSCTIFYILYIYQSMFCSIFYKWYIIYQSVVVPKSINDCFSVITNHIWIQFDICQSKISCRSCLWCKFLTFLQNKYGIYLLCLSHEYLLATDNTLLCGLRLEHTKHISIHVVQRKYVFSIF